MCVCCRCKKWDVPIEMMMSCVCVCCRCKKWDVPIEKVYNKTQREKFAWAIDMATEDYKFTEMDD